MNKKQNRSSAAPTKRQAVKEQRMKRQRQQRLTLILGISAVALILAGIIIIPQLRPAGEFKTVTAEARPQQQDNTMGDPNAPVKIVEYSDFQCPFCARFSEETEGQIVETYVKTGKVQFTYRTFGDWLGPESLAAAEAAYCAGEQNKFWEYHDILFANQTGENVGDFTAKRLEAFAESIGLDMGEFRSCVGDNRNEIRARQDLTDGQAAGITGTPGFLVNGTQVKGAQPFSEFQRVIEAELAKTGSQ